MAEWLDASYRISALPPIGIEFRSETQRCRALCRTWRVLPVKPMTAENERVAVTRGDCLQTRAVAEMINILLDEERLEVPRLRSQ